MPRKHPVHQNEPNEDNDILPLEFIECKQQVHNIKATSKSLMAENKKKSFQM